MTKPSKKNEPKFSGDLASLVKLDKRRAAQIINAATPDQLAALDAASIRKGARRKGYDRIKESTRAHMARKSLSGRDIGAMPAVENHRRKKRAASRLEYFCRIYFPEVFTLKWSPDHLKILTKTETAVVDGGLFAMAMPRGSGKTSIAETAALWSLLYGHREFVCLIGPSEQAALEMMGSMKAELETNDLLLADFPEVCFPIRALEGIINRSAGQLFKGKRTRIFWTADQIVLPTIAGSIASGAIVKTTGITGRIRGMKFKRPDGSAIRPSLVICDDPSTDASARSASQNAQRESILAGAVLGLAGPGKKISGIVPCTVIQPNDLADRILDKDIHPEFNGERTKLVYTWPEASQLWDKYAEIRSDSFRAGGRGKEGTAFYRKNRKEMDAGAVVAWPERKNIDELSALQHAYNLRIRDEAAFFSEYQNEPIAIDLDEKDLPTPAFISQKVNGYKRGEVPLDAEHLTAFIDVQQNLLYWVGVAWTPAFTGYVFDYGTYPEQTTRYFRLQQAKKTLPKTHPGHGLEGWLYKGLDMLTKRLAAKQFERDDGAQMKIGRVMIDANWGQSTETVYSFIRQSKLGQLLLPSHGRGVVASSLPFSEYRKKKGDLVGYNWRIPAVSGKRLVRHVLYDTNYWKSFTFARLTTPPADTGCLSLYEAPPAHHRLFGDQLSAEYRVTTAGRGRAVDEWKHKPDHFDNHYLDCLVGCAVAASIQGVTLGTVGEQQHQPARKTRRQVKRERVKYL